MWRRHSCRPGRDFSRPSGGSLSQRRDESPRCRLRVCATPVAVKLFMGAPYGQILLKRAKVTTDLFLNSIEEARDERGGSERRTPGHRTARLGSSRHTASGR